VRGLYVVGILLALLHPLSLGLAAFLTACLGVLLIAGRQFARGAAVLREPIPGTWVFAIGAIFLLNLWIGLVVIRNAEATGEAWWRFALFGNARGAIRAAVGASVIMLVFALVRIMSRSAPAQKS